MSWDLVQGWFTYEANSPLLFTQKYFWIFFGLVMGGYSLVYKNTARRNIYLFLVSLFFYYKTSGCLLYTSPSPRDLSTSRMPSSA